MSETQSTQTKSRTKTYMKQFILHTTKQFTPQELDEIKRKLSENILKITEINRKFRPDDKIDQVYKDHLVLVMQTNSSNINIQISFKHSSSVLFNEAKIRETIGNAEYFPIPAPPKKNNKNKESSPPISRPNSPTPILPTAANTASNSNIKDIIAKQTAQNAASITEPILTEPNIDDTDEEEEFQSLDMPPLVRQTAYNPDDFENIKVLAPQSPKGGKKFASPRRKTADKSGTKNIMVKYDAKSDDEDDDEDEDEEDKSIESVTKHERHYEDYKLFKMMQEKYKQQQNAPNAAAKKNNKYKEFSTASANNQQNEKTNAQDDSQFSISGVVKSIKEEHFIGFLVGFFTYKFLNGIEISVPNQNFRQGPF